MHPWVKGIHETKGPALFKGEIILKAWNYIYEIKKSSSPEPLSQFQPISAQSIIGWRGFKFVQIKGPAFFQGEIIKKMRKYINKILKSTKSISNKLGTKHPWVKGISLCSNEGPTLFLREIITKKRKYIDEIKKSSSPEPLGQFQPNLAQSILGWMGFKFVKRRTI